MKHVIIWIDQKGARVFEVDADQTADHPTNAELVAHLRHYFNESPPRRGP